MLGTTQEIAWSHVWASVDSVCVNLHTYYFWRLLNSTSAEWSLVRTSKFNALHVLSCTSSVRSSLVHHWIGRLLSSSNFNIPWITWTESLFLLVCPVFVFTIVAGWQISVYPCRPGGGTLPGARRGGVGRRVAVVTRGFTGHRLGGHFVLGRWWGGGRFGWWSSRHIWRGTVYW